METTINVLLSNLIFALFFIRYLAGGGGGAAEVEVERMMQIFIHMHSSNFIALRTKQPKVSMLPSYEKVLTSSSVFQSPLHLKTSVLSLVLQYTICSTQR